MVDPELSLNPDKDKSCEFLSRTTGLKVTCKQNIKKVNCFEFSNGFHMIHSVFTYPKAKQWAIGFLAGKLHEQAKSTFNMGKRGSESSNE